MIAGTLEIQLLANMARLQADMDKAKRTVSSTVSAMNNILGTIGIGVSLAGITSMIKSVVDTGDKLNDLRKITGLTVNELGGLDKQAKLNGTNLDSVARAIGIMSKNMYAGSDAFKSLGIETKTANGQFRDGFQVYADIADRFSKMQDGIQKSALSMQFFGKAGREQIPILNEGRGALDAAVEVHLKYSGVTQASAEASDLFNDNLTLLGGRVTAIKTSFVGELLPTLNTISTAMLSTSQSTGQFSFAASVVVPVLKGLAIAGFTVVDTFRGMGREIGARAAQLEALSRLDFKGMAFIGKSLAEDNAKSRAEYDKLIDTIMNGDKVVQQANVSQQKMLDIQVQIPDATDKATKSIERQAKAYDIEIYKLKQFEDLYKRGRDLTASVATDQEKYNQKLEELNQLKPYVTVETYNRALEKAQTELQGVEKQTETTTSEIDQLWTQAGRNIQSSFANSIFNFFDDGLNGMVKNAGIAVGRILSEFAALKLAQSIGLGAMFGGAAGTAAASGGGGGGLSTFLSGASLASGASSLFGTGFGATSAMSSIGGMLPGSTGAFFGGMGGGAVTGVSSQAALMGAKVASFAGPAIAIAAVDQITRMLVGDKQLGGTVGKVLNFVPILGPLINGLFGRGPMKQGMTSLKGSLGAGGFESGALQTRFDAAGGAFRSNKTDFATVDAVTGKVSTDNGKLNAYAADLSKTATIIIGLINDTTKQVSDSLYTMGADLGISTKGLDDFSHTIKLISEAGKGLTEEQIGNEIAKISDELAKSLIPNIDELAKSGETSLQALARLSAELATLNGFIVALGGTSKDAGEYLKTLSFETRTAFVDLAGGMESLNTKAAFFAQNFLSDAEKLAPSIALVSDTFAKLGISGIETSDQFKELVQSFTSIEGESGKTLNTLLDLAPAFLAVAGAADISRKAAEDLAAAEKVIAATKATADAKERNEFTAGRRSGQIGVTQSIRKQQQLEDANAAKEILRSITEEQAKRLADGFNQARDFVTKQIAAAKQASEFFSGLKNDFVEISTSSHAAAKMQLDATLALSRSGAGVGAINTPAFAAAISKLQDGETGMFGTRRQFEMDRADSANKILEISQTGLESTDASLSVLTQQLDIMQRSYDQQERYFNAILQFTNIAGGQAINQSLLSDASLNKSAMPAFYDYISKQAYSNSPGADMQRAANGANPGVELAARGLITQFGATQATAQTGSYSFDDLVNEISSLKTELVKVTKATAETSSLLATVTKGGRAMSTVAA